MLKAFRNHPLPLRPLFFVELWERFSYYGLSSVLVLYMTAAVVDGGLGMSRDGALVIQGFYASSIFLLGIPFSVVADAYCGPARAVLWGALAISAGHITLALPFDSSLKLGLALVAIGTGLLKPSIGALVGNLYTDDKLKELGMRLFYMSISIGGAIGPVVLGFVRVSLGLSPEVSWHAAFASAAVGMLIALALYVRRLPSFSNFGQATPTRLGTRPAGLRLAIGTAVAFLLMWLFYAENSHPWMGWSLYALLLTSVPVLVFLRRGQKLHYAAVVVSLLVISTLLSAVIGQIFSGLKPVVRDHVGSSLLGLRFIPEYFDAAFSAFIVLITLVLIYFEGLAERVRFMAGVFAVGTSLLACALGCIAWACASSQSGVISPTWILLAYFIKAFAEVLLIPAGIATLHGISKGGDRVLNTSFWYLGAGLGMNLSKILGLSMPTEFGQLSGFFLKETLAILALAVMFAVFSPWLGRQIDGLRSAASGAKSS